LFLGSGSVIHALHGEQDIRKMGGLRKWMPVTFATFLISSLAISGIFPLSGFFSKDELLAAAFEHNKVLWAVGSLASVLTAFYMFRLVFLTFTGEFRGTDEQRHHLHESPSLITVPLMILALLAAVGGIMGLPEGLGFHHWLKGFLAPVLGSPVHEAMAEAAHEGLSRNAELGLMGLAFTLALLAIGVAYRMYAGGKNIPVNDGEETGLSKVVYHKYYIDEIYNAMVVNPIMKLSDLFYSVIDKTAVDGVVNLTGKLSLMVGQQVRKIQSGYIGFYLLLMVLGMVAVFVFSFMIK
jgi:NADH-quinone oxidoreductase subunit L